MSTLFIELQCPQCGAPATLEETNRLFSCEFCKVRSYLHSNSYFRYFIPPKSPESKDIFYVPYWRFKGMLFSSVPGGVKHRFIDVSSQALASGHFPISLGFRSQTQKLRYVTPDVSGYFAKPVQSFEKIIHIFEERFRLSLPKPVYHQAHVGESISLIYSPYYTSDKIYDAVLNEPVSGRPANDFSMADFKGGKPNWKLNFLPTLCPGCGWDLEGEKDALALICRNCDTAWESRRNALKSLKFAHIPDSGEQVIYLPFWRINAEIDGLQLESYADLVKIANMPKVPTPEMSGIPFRFWAPAFKIRPQTFMPLAARMTLTQPQNELVRQFPKGNLFPVTLSIRESLEGLKTILADFIKPRRTLLPRLEETVIKPRSYLLVYLAFHEKHHDLFQPLCHYAIRKSQMALAGNL